MRVEDSRAVGREKEKGAGDETRARFLVRPIVWPPDLLLFHLNYCS